MENFIIKRILICTASIAAGLGIFMFVLTRKANLHANPYEWREPPRFDSLGVALWLLAGAIVFASLFSFTRRPWITGTAGALVGAVVMAVVIMRG